ncbi:hypothetical protein GUJ93_ZPchr0012g19567 [Zizania palustris]|uniref:SAM domain-containing protein n=1 Tax=Zizania palustris TaxID=103762 RepID=A0A8J5WK83_ZIZPA|nr:hypothetical protein GUJ93_ZPchr0012g19567 [Zizania palustris]
MDAVSDGPGLLSLFFFSFFPPFSRWLASVALPSSHSHHCRTLPALRSPPPAAAIHGESGRALLPEPAGENRRSGVPGRIQETGRREMSRGRSPEPLDFFIWTVQDVGLWLEEINLGSYRQVFEENGVNGEYLESLSMFTTEQILRFIRRCHMKWGDFITLCKELRRIKVACLKGEQEVRRPWWAPSCLSVVFVRAAKRNRQSRVVSLKLEP